MNLVIALLLHSCYVTPIRSVDVDHMNQAEYIALSQLAVTFTNVIE